MCNPMTMAAVGAFQADMGNQAANRAYQWKKRMEEAGERSAFLSNAIQQRQLGTQTQQKMRSVNEEIQMISRKGNQVAATAAVRATKGGLQADSASVQALQQQFGKDAMQAIGVRDVEGQGILTFSQQQAQAIEIQTQSRIDSVQAGPAPDKRAQFANILMGAAKGYMQGQSMQGGITPAGETLGPNMLPPSASPAMHNFGAQQIANPFISPVGPAMVNPLTLGGANAQLPQLNIMDFGMPSSFMQTPPTLFSPPSITPSMGFGSQNPLSIGQGFGYNPYSAWGGY
tara:strand:- start:3280 stop:4137 length:858 start_codon:yes stop_codon:yes gene_type:complete